MANVVHASPLLPVREVADRFAVSEKTVRRLIERGELPALKVGGQVRVDPIELAGWTGVRDGLQAFGHVLKDVASEREDGFGQSRYHLRDALEGVDERTAERIENATAPFWCHVRDALTERHP